MMPLQPRTKRRHALRILAGFAAGMSLLLATTATCAAAAPGPATKPVVSVGSYYNDDFIADETGFSSLVSYCDDVAGVTGQIDPFGTDTIDSYLKGTPDTVVTWFAGFQTRSAQTHGLVTPINRVWQNISHNYTPAVASLALGKNGQAYFVPTFQYAWTVMYRKSVFAAHGYKVPRTMDEFMRLQKRMQADGLIPMASTAGANPDDNWSQMGTFDILDMRMNGYDFHMGLLAGRHQWTDPRVKAVFREWRDLLPYTSPNALTNGWWDAMFELLDGSAGMYFTGAFSTLVIGDQAQYDDLAMFPYPAFGNMYDWEKSIDAPTDGVFISKNTTNLVAAERLLTCAGTGAAPNKMVAYDRTIVAAARNASTAAYSPLQKQMASIIRSSNAVAQYLDRDARTDFPPGISAALTSFIANPNQNLDAFLAGIQAYWHSLPPLS